MENKFAEETVFASAAEEREMQEGNAPETSEHGFEEMQEEDEDMEDEDEDMDEEEEDEA